MSDKNEEAFEAWWESDGRYGRAGGGSYEKTFAFNAWQAALSRRPAPAAVPDGWKLVPVAPTPKMADVSLRRGIKRSDWEELLAAAPAAPAPAAQEPTGWISIDDRLPEPGVTVMVYSPPQPGDYPDDVRISFDGIDPDSDGDYWIEHGEHYEHYCAVAKGGDGDCSWRGPAQKAPYTHWMPLPAVPGTSPPAAEQPDWIKLGSGPAYVGWMTSEEKERIAVEQPDTVPVPRETLVGGGK